MVDTGASSHDTAAAHDHVPSEWKRWVFSTNHNDIGTMYLIFAVVMGVVGGVFSILMRLELAEPGNQILGGDHELFYALISEHGLIMVLFWALPARRGASPTTLKRMRDGTWSRRSDRTSRAPGRFCSCSSSGGSSRAARRVPAIRGARARRPWNGRCRLRPVPYLQGTAARRVTERNGPRGTEGANDVWRR